MKLEELQQYSLSKIGVEEVFPFGPGVLVFKVNAKIFLLVCLDTDPLTISVKCDPQKAQELREAYPEVLPGYHLNKKHWNTIRITGKIRNRQIRAWIDHCYELVAFKK
ncbi:MAG: MmcQ/YjbR family DNA-binding protein, partial [Chitinophagaceae bacterium]